MEYSFGVILIIFTVALCISIFFKFLFNFSSDNHKNKRKKLPPPPEPSPFLIVLKNILTFLLQYQKNACFNLETVLQDLKKKHGPIFLVRILGARSHIVICSHSLARQALVEKSTIFSNRPTPNRPKVHKIISSSNGTTWHLLRRNLSSEMFGASCIRAYSDTRLHVLGNLVEKLVSQSNQPINVMENLRFSVFSLLVIMCFGDHKLDEDKVKEFESVQLLLLVRHVWLNLFDFWRGLRKILFGKQLEEFNRARRDQENMFLPLIRARRMAKQGPNEDDQDQPRAYVDTLFDLQLPDEKRAFTDKEIVSLCGEFLNAGTDTIAAALEWIMANLVKNPEIQDKLYQEIAGVVGEPPQLLKPSSLVNAGVVKEKDLEKMPYLKATILEGLRRHPPGHFVLPHWVTEDVELDNYTIPKNASVNFMLAEISRDPMVWENPMEFQPERFLSTSFAAAHDNELDSPQMLDMIKGNREMKMMPFGAGRRMCPGSKFSLHHLEYFVANLVWYFNWKAVDGIGVDLSEKHTFTVVMKNPLRAHIFPRAKSV
ncbi:cytochrome P450 89A2-like [Coffea eugenioides]|uniref:cytochrome P450 89A2-like n=1 Tax=Coffea eugenioides TaxID=49369 RepID=UPI000F604AFB|nr:cytochrome P450 89A2-like [Coffea eugenioides]